MYQFLDPPSIRKEKYLINQQFEGEQYHHGKWPFGNMTSDTSKAIGVGGIPVRFNCAPELTVITLLK